MRDRWRWSRKVLNVCCVLSAGMIAGATGAFVGTPAEISLIRMTSDGRWVLVG